MKRFLALRRLRDRRPVDWACQPERCFAKLAHPEGVGLRVGDVAADQQCRGHGPVQLRRTLARLCSFLLALHFASASAAGQQVLTETEPNDTPAQANPFQGEAILAGSMSGQDQDAFAWTVSAADAGFYWNLELQGMPETITKVDVMQVEFASNGTDVKSRKNLFSFSASGADVPAASGELIFTPGAYILGVSKASGEGNYRLAVRRGVALPARTEKEPNDRAGQAEELGEAFQLRGDSEATQDWFAWTITEAGARSRWSLRANTAVGHRLTMTLLDAASRQMAQARAEAGELQLVDLGLEPERYLIRLQGGGASAPYTLRSDPQEARSADLEEEPNNQLDQANVISLDRGVRGRITSAGETDLFRFEIGESEAARQYSFTLEPGRPANLALCLMNEKNEQMSCREGAGALEMVDLALSPGAYFVRVQGKAGADNVPYAFTASHGALPEGREREPNDRLQEATRLGPDKTIRGRFSGQDVDHDFFHFVVEEEPQLWRIQAAGDAIWEIAYLDVNGQALQRKRFGSTRRARLSNLYLLPGEHYVRVSGKEGNYLLRALPIGPPNPADELEPNDDSGRAEKLEVDGFRKGLLEDKEDVDVYRFFLAAEERVEIEITPPADGAIDFNLYRSGQPLTQENKSLKGERLVFEAVLIPGDYELRLSAREPSDAEYAVRLKRLDPFLLPEEIEPNNHLNQATPVHPSASTVIKGKLFGREVDFYRIPPLDRDTTLRLKLEGDISLYGYQYFQSGKSAQILKKEVGTEDWVGRIPAGEALFFSIDNSFRSDRNYRLILNFDPAPPSGSREPLPVRVDLKAETSTAAAAWHLHQQVPVEAILTNQGAATLHLQLETTSSHFLWRPKLETFEVSLAAGASVRLPVEIEVAPNAWADAPVQVTLLARDGARMATGGVQLNASCAAQPVNSFQSWKVPGEMLGGINMAWDAMGGQFVQPSKESRGHAFLIDGITAMQHGWSQIWTPAEGPEDIVLTVELAGSRPVPVRGAMINPQASTSRQLLFTKAPFDFLLSMDGKSFQVVYSGAILNFDHEQAFSLETAIPARFARLSLRAPPRGGFPVGLGEWKVVADPSFTPEATPFNLASPELGGHVVWSIPQLGASGGIRGAPLKPEISAYIRRRPAERTLEWAVGFHHNRAARIQRIRWHKDGQQAEHQALDSVEVLVSTDNPTSGWTSIGRIELAGNDETVDFIIPEPVWARFVLFRSDISSLPDRVYYPSQIEIFEQAPGPDDRSILGEWGHYSRVGAYEWKNPSQWKVSSGKDLTPDRREQARLLQAGEIVEEAVDRGKDVDWFRIQIPENQNLLTLTLEGEPTVEASLNLEDSRGARVPLEKAIQSAGRFEFQAWVEPGTEYFIKVEEPPRSIVFTWDTSASMNPYLPLVWQTLDAFVSLVKPDREVANFLPYGDRLLLDRWVGDPYVLRQALQNYRRRSGSSDSEGAIIQALKSLRGREGVKAVVVMTDAETPGYAKTAELWSLIRELQPRIFAMGIGGGANLSSDAHTVLDLLEDWGSSNGFMEYLRTVGEMGRNLDRVTCMLRRPAAYRLSLETSAEDPPGPGWLEVVAASGAAGTPLMADAAVELILDASGSMLQRMEGKRRMDVAKEVLADLVTNRLPDGTPIALRVFGHVKPDSCDTELVVGLKPLNRSAVGRTISGIQAKNLAKTPIADALAAVSSDLKDATGQRIVILVTDGEETCDGDPAAVIQSLVDQGIDVRVNIVGFAVDEAELKEEFQNWARLGRGRYFDADSAEELSKSLEEALHPSFSVIDAAGKVVATGTLGGEPVSVPGGSYSV
ncbi:MAG TPA: VWA domain-containing protein, partial [Acidobacteriota bacterium]|nr:VWA domain-containing protein [Acidobacteriota bacterium]